MYVPALMCVCCEKRGAKPPVFSAVTEHDDSVEFPLR